MSIIAMVHAGLLSQLFHAVFLQWVVSRSSTEFVTCCQVRPQEGEPCIEHPLLAAQISPSLAPRLGAQAR